MPTNNDWLMCFTTFNATATAFIHRDQLALLNIKLLLLDDLPLVEAVTTQGITLVLAFGWCFFERDNVTHASRLLGRYWCRHQQL